MKKFLIPILAVSVSTFSAFATRPVFQTFRFDGDSASWQDRVDPTKYSTETPVGCSGTPSIQCSLNAAPDGTTGHPLITETLYTALRNANLSMPDFDESAIGGKP